MVTVTGPPMHSEDKANLTFYTGLCVPADCTESDMTSLQELFEGAAEFNEIENPNISYFSVTNYVNKRQEMPKSPEIIIGLIIFGVIGLIGVGTIIHLTKFWDKPNIRSRNISDTMSGSERLSYDSLIVEGEVNPDQISKKINKDTAILYRKKIQAIPFIAFSAIRNSTKLVSSQKNAQIHPQDILEKDKTLQIMNGLRFYSMLWIIYANTIALTEKGVVENIKEKPEFFKDFFFTIFPAAFF